MFFIRKNKVKRKTVKVGENLTDRAGRKFKNQFNSKRKSAGEYFPQAANLTKKIETMTKFRLNSHKFLAESTGIDFWTWKILTFQWFANKISQLIHSKCHSIKKKDKNNHNTKHSILVEWNILVHSRLWHDEFFGFILPKKTLENSDPRYFFLLFWFGIWTKKPPKQYLPRSIRVIEWNDAKVTSFYHSKASD